MEIRTYRAATMQEALEMVRQDLGSSAAVLHTREVRGSRLLRWIPGLRQIEVTASTSVSVPSRLPNREAPNTASGAAPAPAASPETNAGRRDGGPRSRFSDELKNQLNDLQAMVADLCRNQRAGGRPDAPQEMFQLYTDLIEAEIAEELARELVERARAEMAGEELNDPALAKAHVSALIEADINIAGPIRVSPGQCRVVALVGPTGVGKTTTIAKLAANFRLREKRKVGLITVDTYRIAAVEQLRTYAEIIDLPMQVVSTPREMREAVARMAELDLVLMDTAGRSPRDEVKIHELKSFLSEARADEVHLVLGSGAASSTLQRTAERFSLVGVNRLILTKLDEATGLGNLLPLLRNCSQPLSYLTNGQNVPDDIEVANNQRLARLMLDVTAEQRY